MEIQEITRRITPILQKYHVSRAGLFGSMTTGDATKESDVDILVQLSPTTSLMQFAGMRCELEDALGIPVDVVEYDAIKPRLRPTIISGEVLVYDHEAR
jgi:uncharacterized protein